MIVTQTVTQVASSLGYRYYNGEYGAVDYAKAHEYYMMAARRISRKRSVCMKSWLPTATWNR